MITSQSFSCLQPIMQLRINIPPLTRALLGLDLAISIAFQLSRFKGGQDFLATIPQVSPLNSSCYVLCQLFVPTVELQHET